VTVLGHLLLKRSGCLQPQGRFQQILSFGQMLRFPPMFPSRHGRLSLMRPFGQMLQFPPKLLALILGVIREAVIQEAVIQGAVIQGALIQGVVIREVVIWEVETLGVEILEVEILEVMGETLETLVTSAVVEA
jgi:hypothetical protein